MLSMLSPRAFLRALPRFGEHAFGMKLHAFHWNFRWRSPMMVRRAVFFGGPGADFEFGGQTFSSTMSEW
jgi:hypothetical protein